MCGTKMSLFLIVHTKWVQTIFRNKNFEEKISVPYQFSYLFKSKNVFCPWNTYSVLNSTKKRPILLKVQFVKIGNTEKWRLFIKTQCETRFKILLKSLTTRLCTRASLSHFELLWVALSRFELLWVALNRFESLWVAFS